MVLIDSCETVVKIPESYCCYQVGMNDFVTKPVSMEQLRKLLCRIAANNTREQSMSLKIENERIR